MSKQENELSKLIKSAEEAEGWQQIKAKYFEAFIFACQHGPLDTVKELLDVKCNKYWSDCEEQHWPHAVDVHACFKSGSSQYTALEWACRNKKLELIKVLLACDRIDVNYAGEYGNRNPLGWACEKGATAVAELLLSRNGINVNKKQHYSCGWPAQLPIKLAMQECHYDVIKLLIMRADIKLSESGKDTPLIWVTKNDSSRRDLFAWVLLQVGIDINAQDANGNTALMVACEKQHFAAMELLLARDEIDTSLKNQDGQTVHDIAKPQRGPGALRRLKEHAKKPKNKKANKPKINKVEVDMPKNKSPASFEQPKENASSPLNFPLDDASSSTCSTPTSLFWLSASLGVGLLGAGAVTATSFVMPQIGIPMMFTGAALLAFSALLLIGTIGVKLMQHCCFSEEVASASFSSI